MLNNEVSQNSSTSGLARHNNFQGSIKLISSQLNRGPLLHRSFGGNKTATGNGTKSSSVGAVKISPHGSGYLGG